MARSVEDFPVYLGKIEFVQPLWRTVVLEWTQEDRPSIGCQWIHVLLPREVIQAYENLPRMGVGVPYITPNDYRKRDLRHICTPGLDPHIEFACGVRYRVMRQRDFSFTILTYHENDQIDIKQTH